MHPMIGAGSNNLQEIHVASLSIDPMHRLLDREEGAQLDDNFEQARKLLAGRIVWNINSTAVGGGVAEMLRSLLAYARGAGLDARWRVIGGDAGFFRVTKRLPNFLHGAPGDGETLSDADAQHHRATL